MGGGDEELEVVGAVSRNAKECPCGRLLVCNALTPAGLVEGSEELACDRYAALKNSFSCNRAIFSRRSLLISAFCAEFPSCCAT